MAAIIHLGHALPHDSSDLPGNASSGFPKRPAGRRRAFPYLILHHEEFAWPRLLPNAPVSSYLTVSPITAKAAGLFSVALVVARTNARAPGCYPARCPTVFGLSSFAKAKAIARSASLHGVGQYNKERLTFKHAVSCCKAYRDGSSVRG